MPNGFFIHNSNGNHGTTARNIIAAVQAAYQGISIPTGIWNDPVWDPCKFLRWFRKSLDIKISNDTRPYRKLDEQYQVDLRCDCRVINDAARRIIWPGKNLLRLKELKKRYPEVDNPVF